MADEERFEEVQRWTAKRRVAPVLSVLRGETTVVAAALRLIIARTSLRAIGLSVSLFPFRMARNSGSSSSPTISSASVHGSTYAARL